MRRLQGGGALTGRALGVFVVLFLLSTTWLVMRHAERAAGSSTTGYWLVGTDGGVFSFGRATFQGSTGDVPLNQPIVGITPTPSGRGYWMVASDGGIFAFGDGAFVGSMGGTPLNKPIVAMAATPSGGGYWLVASDGGVFAFGDAAFYGSTGAIKLNKPIVDIAATPSGRGYWLVASDGGIFAFGDAGFFGSVGEGDLAKRIHAMAPTRSGRGYWLVAGDGKIFAYGDAGFFGSASENAEKRVIDIAPSASGRGYYVTTSNGQVLPFGDATFHGGTDDLKLNQRIAAMAAMNGREPPVAADDTVTTAEDLEVTVDVLANDTSPGGGLLTLQSVGVPEHGTASPVEGKVVYRPAADSSGTDALTYVVADDGGDVATGRVTVTVTPVDDVPAPVNDAVTVAEDTPIAVAVLANDAGLGDGVASVSVGKQPAHGTATVNDDRTLRYLPEPNFAGTDSLRYRVVDVDGDEGEATVTITVLPENDIPVAVDDGPFTVEGGKSVTMKVLENDDLGDGTPQIRLVDPADGTPTEAGRITTPAGEFKRTDGGIGYTPAGGVTGAAEIQYVLIDEDGTGDTSNPATVTINVLNGAPKAMNQSLAADEGGTVTGTLIARDPEGDPLTFRVFDGSGPAPVRLSLNERTGEFSFGPVNQPGRYSFRFIARDGSHDSNTATVTIEVKPAVQEPPPTQESTTTTTTGSEPSATTTTTRRPQAGRSPGSSSGPR
jgi:hypothetical protein